MIISKEVIREVFNLPSSESLEIPIVSEGDELVHEHPEGGDQKFS